MKIEGLQAIEERAKTFLSEAIRRWYPEHFQEETSINTGSTFVRSLEEKEMNTFLLNKTQFYIDRSDEYTRVLNYVTGTHQDLVLINDQLRADSDKVHGQPVMALISQPGDGKTMFLGKFVLDIEVDTRDIEIE